MIAVLLGALLLAEPFGPRVIVATATVLLGIAVVRGGEPQRQPDPAPEAAELIRDGPALQSQVRQRAAR